MKKSLVLFIIVLLLTLGANAQASPGFVKVSSVSTGTSFVDSGCLNLTTCAYQVTAVGSNGLESPPALCASTQLCLSGNQAVVVMPSSGTHTITLTWIASTSTGVASYNVYRENSPLAGTNLNTTVN